MRKGRVKMRQGGVLPARRPQKIRSLPDFSRRIGFTPPRTHGKNPVRMKLHHLSPALSYAALLAAVSLNAATTVPVGAVAQNIVAGSQLISVPFQKPISYQGAVASVSGPTIGLVNVPTLPDIAYVQVLTGTAEGVVATISSYNASSVTVQAPITGLTGSCDIG